MKFFVRKAHLLKLVVSSILLVAITAMAGCGRYEAPIVPEQLISESVKELGATVDSQTVTLSWKRPSVDARGKRLKDIDGYRVYRAMIFSPSNLKELQSARATGPDFTEVGWVADGSHEKLTKLQDEAEARGDMRRKVKLEPSDTTFSFVDPFKATSGVFLYKVVPVNQSWEEGAVDKYIKVDRALNSAEDAPGFVAVKK